jgi:hypothetical protein
MRHPAAPQRHLNRFLWRRVERSGKQKGRLQIVGGWPHYTSFHDVLRAETIVATPLTITRLERVADAIGFPRDEIFLDGAVR